MTDEEAYKIVDEMCDNITLVGPTYEAIEIIRNKARNFDTLHYNPDPFSEGMFNKIEKALGFKLYTWQKTFIISGTFRLYGHTTAFILNELVNPGTYFIDLTPIHQSDKFYEGEKYRLYKLLKDTGVIKAEVIVEAHNKIVEVYPKGEPDADK